MAYWLMKSEPDVFSWDRLVRDQSAPWDGVRNYQANNNMKNMKLGDQAFFYHSNQGREIVGVMTIIKCWYLDPSDETGRFGMVDVAPHKPFKNPVTLEAIKKNPKLETMALLRQGRLSVSPVTKTEWGLILRLGGL